MPRYLIALGSSHHEAEKYINNARVFLLNIKNLSLAGQSRIYKNNAAQTNYNCLFHNAVWAVTTYCHPRVFYRELSFIESTLGRIRTYRNAKRTLDIDILMSIDYTYESSSFFIPHKQAFQRHFFVIPALEALKSASWPVPLVLLQASFKFGRENLQPLFAE